jgi:hypothetical protein
MKASSLFVLIGRDVSTATRDVNAFFMLQLRCTRGPPRVRVLLRGNQTG